MQIAGESEYHTFLLHNLIVIEISKLTFCRISKVPHKDIHRAYILAKKVLISFLYPRDGEQQLLERGSTDLSNPL